MPRALRRWTVVLVPHGSADTRSISLTERALRIAISFVALILVVGLAGAATLGWTAARTRPDMAAVRADTSDPAVALLSGRLTSLKDTLNAIRDREAVLRLHAGSPPSPTAAVVRHTSLQAASTAAHAADSLMARAGSVSKGYAEIADSIERRAQRGRRGGKE